MKNTLIRSNDVVSFRNCLEKRCSESPQFAEVLHFINVISDLDLVSLTEDAAWLATDPWTGDKIAPTVANINTNAFIALFPGMKPTSCERHLRRYKALLNAFKIGQ